MGEKKNYSLLVVLVFFVLFLIFVLVFNPKITGNAVVDLSGIKENIAFGENISGKMYLNLSSGDFIKNSSSVELSLVYNDKVLRTKSMDAATFFSKTNPKLDSVIVDGVKVYNKTGNYSIDLSEFKLSTNPYYGTIDVVLSVSGSDKEIKGEESVKIANSSSSFSIIRKFDQLGSLKFEVKKGEMVVEDTSSTFEVGDYIWCLVDFDNNTLTTKNGKLDIYFYSPEGLDAKFMDVVNNKANLSDEEVGGICSDEDKNICGAFYKVKNESEGDWECKAVASTAAGTVEAYSSDAFFSKEFVMGNKPPVVVKNIPDLNVSKNGSYETIDMDSYFDDEDDLEYGVSGLKYLSAIFDSGNKLLFANPTNFEGVENITVRASDGYSVSESNYFLVKVGSGVFSAGTAGCIPDWKATSWSACVNGVQVRSVVDVNSCNSDVGKPADSQPCNEMPSAVASGEKYKSSSSPLAVAAGISPLAWVLLAVGILAIAGIGIYYFVNKKKNIGSDENDIIESSPIVQTEKKVENASNAVSDSGLDDYIEKSLSANVDANSIRKNLLNAGWDKKVVEDKIQFMQAKVYVRQKLNQGFDKEKLKESFLLKGWSEEQIKKLFEE